MTTILVTGCAGFIGSHLCELLLFKGYKVTGVDNFDPFYDKEIKLNNLKGFINHPSFSFLEYDITRDLDKINADIDVVIHLAAKAGIVPSLKDPFGYINTNIIGTQKVLEFMKLRNIKKLIFASSSSIYGNNKKIPFSETDIVDFPISNYAFTKKSAELLNYSYHHLYDINVINLRFFTVFGPRQRPDLAIHKFVNNIVNDKPITLFGDGSTARDYTFIEDTVNGIYSALNYCMKNSKVYLTVNLGNHTPVKLIDLVKAIYNILDKKPQIYFANMRPGDVDITFADISLAQQLFNYHPHTNIEDGLIKFINWYKAENLILS